jgi:sugar phosphate isomerase/epimerase
MTERKKIDTDIGMDIGITSNFSIGMDTKKALDMIKAAGFTSVMIAQGPDFEGDVKHALKIGLKIPFVHLDYSMADYVWVTGEKQQAFVRAVICAIEVCARHGIKTAVMHVQRDDCLYKLRGPDARGLDTMRALLSAAEKNGVRVAIENLDRYNIGHVFYLLDKIRSPWLGFCYDGGHHNLYIPKIDLLRRFRGRVFAVHLHDNLMNYREGMDCACDGHILPGDGKIDFARVMEGLRSAGYDGSMVWEVRKKHSQIGAKLYENMTDAQFLTEALTRANNITHAAGAGGTR